MNISADTVKWLLGGLAWLMSIGITYWIGRRAKIDDIRLKRIYEIAEEIAILIQKDHHERESLLEQFDENFGHIPERRDAYAAVDRFPDLYQSIRRMMGGLPDQINTLQDLNRTAIIYLDKTLTKLIEEYIAVTRFSYSTDGGFLINTYIANFFENLQSQEKLNRRRDLHEQIMEKLRKLKP